MLPSPPSTAMTNDSKVKPPAAAGLNVPTMPTIAPARPASAAAMPNVNA